MVYIEGFKNEIKKISASLSNLEEILIKNGINIPEQNIELESNEKIKLPKNYIRKIKYFEKKYRLKDIIDDEVLRKNILYSLQTTDLFNYFFNRFNISLSVGKVFKKYAIINVVSILEAIFYGVIKNLHEYCFINPSICKKNACCSFYFKSHNKYKFSECIEILQKREIISIDDKIKELIINLKKVRDNIHIWTSDKKDFFNNSYSIREYNTLIKLLQLLAYQIPDNLIKFKNKRESECKKLSKINFLGGLLCH